MSIALRRVRRKENLAGILVANVKSSDFNESSIKLYTLQTCIHFKCARIDILKVQLLVVICAVVVRSESS